MVACLCVPQHSTEHRRSAYLHTTVPSTRGDPPSVWAKPYALDDLAVALEGDELVPLTDVPELCVAPRQYSRRQSRGEQTDLACTAAGSHLHVGVKRATCDDVVKWMHLNRSAAGSMALERS